MDEGSTCNLDRNIINKNNTEIIYKSLAYKKGKQERLITEDINGEKESIFLYFSSLTADLVIFASACSAVWSSRAFEKLKSTDLEINPLGLPLTSLQESWIAALPCLGATVGPLLFGELSNIYGRKKTLMFLATLEIVSYIILAFATNIYLYYITRLLLSIGEEGTCFTVLPVYNGEICEDHNRGKIGCIMGIFVALGGLYTLSIAPLLSLKMFTLTCMIPLLFDLVSFTLIISESPVYLVSIDDKENAIRALMKLRKSKKAAEQDLLKIMQTIDRSSSSGNCGYVEIFKMPAFHKGLIICTGLCFFQQFSGFNAVLACIGPIFELSGSDISPNLSASLVATVEVVAIIAASVFVEKLGRRFLLLMSITISSLSFFVLGLYFYLKDIEFNYIKTISWLPVVSLMVFILFFFLDLGPYHGFI